jgi:hypothetical protein
VDNPALTKLLKRLEFLKKARHSALYPESMDKAIKNLEAAIEKMRQN